MEGALNNSVFCLVALSQPAVAASACRRPAAATSTLDAGGLSLRHELQRTRPSSVATS